MSELDYALRSFAAWYETGPNSRYIRTKYRAADLLDVMELAEPPGLYYSPTLPNLSVFQALSPGTFGRCDVGAGSFIKNSYRAEECTVVGPGTESRVLFREAHDFRVYNLPSEILRPLFAEAGVNPEAVDLGPLHSGMVGSQRVGAALDLLWDEASGEHPVWRLAAECAVTAVGTALLRTMQRLKKSADPPPLRPCDWRLRWVMEQMDSRLCGDVSLSELASSVDLSHTHLTNLFRMATGLPPYRWLLRRRLQRAVTLLADTKRSITEIALSCGFASSQHLATMLKKNIGVTPTEFRRERSR